MDPSMLTRDNDGRAGAALKEAAVTSLAAAARAQRRGSRNQYCADKAALALGTLLLPGIGCASVSKNGEPVIELQGLAGDDPFTAGDAERIALAEPEHEWCIHMVGLLDERHYRREGPGLWRLYARGYGLS